MLAVPLLGTLLLSGVLLCVTGSIAAPLAQLSGLIVWPLLWFVSHVAIWGSLLPGAFFNIGGLDAGIAWGYYGILATVVVLTLRKQASTQATTPFTGIPPATTAQPWQRTQIIALIVLTLATLVLAPIPDERLTITFLNVGPTGEIPQGQAIFIHTADGKTLLIDGGPDATSLSQTLDSHLPVWQRSLDAILLTVPDKNHLPALLDIVNRYSIGEVVDAGMIHPTVTYSLWRRRIDEHTIKYHPVVQGMALPLGATVSLQILWPRAGLHKGSNEVQDNGLIVRLLGPGIRMLLVGTGAQDAYTLNGLLTSIDPAYLSADVVQLLYEPGKMIPGELQDLLGRTHPKLVIVTKGIANNRQQAKQDTPPDDLSVPTALSGDWQVIQTSQESAIEVNSITAGWGVRLI